MNGIIDGALAYIGNDIAARGWNLAGSVTGTSNSVTVPNDATEVYIECHAEVNKYTGTFLLPTTQTVLLIGGYYMSTSDYGLCNVNLSNNGKTIKLRNCYYGARNYNTSATMSVYYKIKQ